MTTHLAELARPEGQEHRGAAVALVRVGGALGPVPAKAGEPSTRELILAACVVAKRLGREIGRWLLTINRSSLPRSWSFMRSCPPKRNNLPFRRSRLDRRVRIAPGDVDHACRNTVPHQVDSGSVRRAAIEDRLLKRDAGFGGCASRSHGRDPPRGWRPVPAYHPGRGGGCAPRPAVLIQSAP